MRCASPRRARVRGRRRCTRICTWRSHLPEIRYYEAVQRALAEEMARDEKVFVLGEDVGLVGGTFRATEGLMAEFGARRVRDTPIAEAAIIGVAIGAAMTGLRPVAELMTLNFGIVAMDQIINHASKASY